MKIKYNVKGSERKRLAECIGKIIGEKPVYQFLPTYAYKIGYYTLDFEGTLIFDDMTDSEEVEKLIEKIERKGFVFEETENTESENNSEDAGAENAQTENDEEHNAAYENLSDLKQSAEEKTSVEKENNVIEETSLSAEQNEEIIVQPELTESQKENIKFTAEMPKSFFEEDTLEKLKKIISSKENLIKKAFLTQSLEIEEKTDRICFPWFELKESRDSDAYIHFISALCEMAKNQKRINASKKEEKNEKYTFRCFLLRLGFIGNEYKDDRKVLLRNLSGSSAFKNGSRKEEGSDEKTR